MSSEPKPHKSHVVRHLEHAARAAAELHGRPLHPHKPPVPSRPGAAPLPPSRATRRTTAAAPSGES